MVGPVMLVEQYCAILTKAVEPLNDTIVDDWGAFHTNVSRLIESHKINGLEFGVWAAKLSVDDWVHYDHSTMIEYNREFTKHKNRTVAGRLHKVWFQPKEPVMARMTLEEAKEYLQVKGHKERIKTRRKSVEYFTKNLAEAHEELELAKSQFKDYGRGPRTKTFTK